MLSLAIILAVDAVVLMFILKVVSDEDLAFGSAFIFALVAAIVTSVVAFSLAIPLGIFGGLLGAVLGAIGVGVGVSALYGVEIKRSMLVGVVFVVAHIGVALAMNAVFAS